jgi:hypothetical protein
MLPKKHAPLVFALMMSCSMAFIMSGALTFINLGFSSDSVQRWLLIFPKAWLVAFPVVLVLAPMVRKITEKIASKE